MVLINLIKKSFNCVVENPSITLFLVLFLIGSNILASCILTAKTKPIALALILCFFALIFIFFSGWLKVIKESCNREKIKEKNFYSIFLEGIGENVIPASISICIYTVLLFATVIFAQFVALHFFGNINFFLDDINKLTIENGNIMEYFNNLDVNQKYIIYGWNICFIVSLIIFNFLSLFYFPALYFEESKFYIKPFSSFWNSLKFLFKNFFSVIALSLFIYLLNMILAVLNAKFSQNAIVSIVLLLVHIYFISYVVMLIFNYYESKNNSSDGTDSIRKNKAGNTISEEA